MAANYGLSPEEIDTVHIISPETAAHNIALAYIQSTFCANSTFPEDDVEVEPNSVFSISKAYADAYNYAYNYITHENDFLNQAE